MFLLATATTLPVSLHHHHKCFTCIWTCHNQAGKSVCGRQFDGPRRWSTLLAALKACVAVGKITKCWKPHRSAIISRFDVLWLVLFSPAFLSLSSSLPVAVFFPTCVQNWPANIISNGLAQIDFHAKLIDVHKSGRMHAEKWARVPLQKSFKNWPSSDWNAPLSCPLLLGCWGFRRLLVQNSRLICV